MASGSNKNIEVDDLGWTNDIPDCPTYHPTKEEFGEDPLTYLQKIAPEASKFGICKIVSPLNASVPAPLVLTRQDPGFKFATNVQPIRLSHWNVEDHLPYFLPGKKFYNLREYEKLADDFFRSRYGSNARLPAGFIEKEFWAAVMAGKGHVEYASDIDGSVFSSSPDDELAQSNWNLKNFSRLPQSVLRLLRHEIPGVTDPMLYIGMLFSMFAWHVEDHYLYSINYSHAGAAKLWYGVPGHAALAFETVVGEHVYSRDFLSTDGAPPFDILARKTTIFPPSILLQHNVPVCKAVQNPGEFVITFPRSYHAGFSQGFNCGEAVNFATGDWFPFGDAARLRYSLLRKQPIIPHEELICKESMLLSKQSSSTSDSVSQRTIKNCFIDLIKFQQHARKTLVESKACRRVRSKTKETEYCSICERECYLSYFRCKCRRNPICLHHQRELQDCPCKTDCKIYMREGITELETAAQMFEMQNGRGEITHKSSTSLRKRVLEDETSLGVLNQQTIRVLKKQRTPEENWEIFPDM